MSYTLPVFRKHSVSFCRKTVAMMCLTLCLVLPCWRWLDPSGELQFMSCRLQFMVGWSPSDGISVQGEVEERGMERCDRHWRHAHLAMAHGRASDGEPGIGRPGGGGCDCWRWVALDVWSSFSYEPYALRIWRCREIQHWVCTSLSKSSSFFSVVF